MCICNSAPSSCVRRPARGLTVLLAVVALVGLVGEFQALHATELTSVAPATVAQGARQVQLTVLGTNFGPSTQVLITPPISQISPLAVCPFFLPSADITIVSKTVVSTQMILVVINVNNDASTGARLFVASDCTVPVPRNQIKLLLVTNGNSLSAPLQVQSLVVLHPRNGTVVAQGDDLFAEAVLAGAGSGLVTGEWLWDGNVNEQFTATLAGGQPATLRTSLPLPTLFLGPHTLELRITSPNRLQSRPVQLLVNPGSWRLLRLLMPRFGAGFTPDAPPLLQWTILPGVAKYQVGFSSRPLFSTIEEWHDVADTEWRVPKKVWDRLPEGELYWTVRGVEMSGESRKPAPMRRILRVPSGVLSSTGGAPGVLEWHGLKTPSIYRVTVSRDADGKDIVRRFLVAGPQADLHSIQDQLQAGQMYYWQVEAFSPDGRRILLGPQQSFTGAASPRAERVKPGWSFQPVSLRVAPASDLASRIVSRAPTPNQTVSDDHPGIAVSFNSGVSGSGMTLLVDDTDVTALAQISESRVSYAPVLPLDNGHHEVTVALGADAESWKFTVAHKKPAAPENVVAPTRTDEEAPPPVTPGAREETPGGNIGPDIRTQIGINPQIISGSAPDTITMNVGQQMTFQNGPWRVETNGTGLLTALISPQPRHALGRFNDYVGHLSYKGQQLSGDLRFGVIAPTMYADTEFVTTAVPREGVEPVLRTPAGRFSFYSNTRDLDLGGGTAASFHQDVRGAAYELPLPKNLATLRVMWLSSRDSGSPTTVFLDSNGNPVSAPDPQPSPGSGDTYGALLQVHLPGNLLWGSEYAWSETNFPTTFLRSRARVFGRAWRIGILGSWRKTSFQVSYRDVTPNVDTPANPSLSPLSSANRRGVDTSVSQATRIGKFMVGYQYFESDVNRSDRPGLSLHNLTWGWSKNLATATALSIQGHEVRTFTGDLPPGTQSQFNAFGVLLVDSAELLALETDQRDLGFNTSITHQAGTLTITAGVSRDWFRNRLIHGQQAGTADSSGTAVLSRLSPSNTITTGLQVGGTWRPRSFFQFQSHFSTNWVASTLSGTRFFSLYVQPMLTWQHTGLSVTPLVTVTRTKGSLGTGVLTQDLNASQLGGRLSWRLPGPFRVSTLSFEGSRLRMRNGVAPLGSSPTDITDKRLLGLLTLVGNRNHGG